MITLWQLFANLTAHLWVIVQFWVFLSLVAKLTIKLAELIFGPSDGEGHLDLMANREKYFGARIATNAEVRGVHSIFWFGVSFIIKYGIKVAELVLGITRGILGVDKSSA